MVRPNGTRAERRTLTWANAMSLTRVPLAAAFFLVDNAAVRVAIIIAAAATDYADGWLARRLRQEGRAGEMMDPLADKIFVLTAIAAYVANGSIEPWEVAVLLARDVLITIAFLLALAAKWPIRFRARWSGKVVTGLQVAAVLVLAASPALATTAVIVTGAATLWAIFDYARFGLRSLRGAATAG